MVKPLGGADVVVVGAGIVGAAVAYECATAGLTVAVVERDQVSGGTTGAGEGNLLVSDKEPGPELDLALLSLRRWREWAETLDTDIEYEPKGGLVVASTAAALASLTALAEGQRAAGVETAAVADPRTLEPHLRDGTAGAVHYPQDSQVMPSLAAAELLRRPGITVHTGLTLTGLTLTGGKITAAVTDAGTIPTGAVVNAAGTWAAEVAARCGSELPVAPRRGFVLVTEPLPRMIRHKVYSADYVANVAAGTAGLETSPVVEGTAAGPVLIGASRERVGFDKTVSVPVLRRLAAQAVELFPFLTDVQVMRAYRGFRPYTPDHLPIIGADETVGGLWHACGHEGAGVGLAAATGLLVAQGLTGGKPALDTAAFRPGRFGRPVEEAHA
ncbi:NAD(P)/FAD-dependent oxidoreductase [Phytomonospora endophytica]|uniref:Glycine/D-amino acid oxidase-like deaminating enzyme n=1 Tax=Phytomonospora endophytica TaxID=714109 RepID=A0A841FJ57_9ACTN|nr:FAD-dependent oxidoreductase [Phytomonospora endophytica]MBB6035845.1 glycine/D-amino acid oxidase-like deaminating enzyme [Phytomonospora endophytica]GIG71524.1 oxidoreductase [Phytomonospora endophytica]